MSILAIHNGELAEFGSVEIAEMNGAEPLVAGNKLFAVIDEENNVLWQQSETAPAGASAYNHADFSLEKLPDGNGGWIKQAQPEPMVIVDKVRFLDLLGSAASKFKTAIKMMNASGDPEQLGHASDLEVAEKYLDSAPDIDLQSPRIAQFLGVLQMLEILTADDVTRISANQTAEEAVAA